MQCLYIPGTVEIIRHTQGIVREDSLHRLNYTTISSFNVDILGKRNIHIH